MNDIRKTIHAKIIKLARQLGHDARSLRYDQEIPSAGILDSPALMELIMWFENEFGLEVDQDQLTLENFGTIDRMAAYEEKARS
jgi:acyl carrier protein